DRLGEPRADRPGLPAPRSLPTADPRRRRRRRALHARARRAGVRPDRGAAPRLGGSVDPRDADRRRRPARALPRLGEASATPNAAAGAVRPAEFQLREPRDADRLRRALDVGLLPRAVHAAAVRLLPAEERAR